MCVYASWCSLRSRIFSLLRPHTRKHTHTPTHTHKHTQTQTHTNAHTPTTHPRAHKHTHTHSYTYTRTFYLNPTVFGCGGDDAIQCGKGNKVVCGDFCRVDLEPKTPEMCQVYAITSMDTGIGGV